MGPGPAASAWKCTRCGHAITARGGLAPRFCAVCGDQLEIWRTDWHAVTYAARPSTSGKAVAALVLGLCSLLVCAPLGIVAIPLGLSARREIEQSGGQLQGQGMATAGGVLGAIGLALLALLGLAVVAS